MRMMRGRTAHRRDSGFALLLVFLLAASIAIALYMEMPRAAFESQRALEETLIERGEQYQRAIQLYYRKTRTYPPTLEALENTNRIRFLRKRYKDPMTGKDEWRLIHIGPGFVLTDSLVTKPPGQQQAQQTTANTFITELTPVGGGTSPSTGVVSRAQMRRASEGGAQAAGMTAESTPPGKLGCTYNIPNTYLAAGFFVLLMMLKK